jgi:hypothetical protein
MVSRDVVLRHRRIAGLAVVVATLALAMPIQPAGSSDVRASTEARTFVIDGVIVELSADELPAAEFSVTDPGSASQWAVAAEMDPYWEVSVIAVPFGTTAGVETLPTAEEGGSDVYRDALATFRASQQAELVGTPTAMLFGQPVKGVVYQLALPVPADDKAPSLLGEWVVEAGKRLWITRWVRVLSDADAEADATLTLTALADELSKPTTIGADPSRSTDVDGDRQVAVDAGVDLPTPDWWTGDCDHDWYLAHGSHVEPYRLGATYRGMPACGPRPAWDGVLDVLVQFFPGAFGEREWQCVELSMRYLYLAYGIEPYDADGYNIATEYTGSRLEIVSNGLTSRPPEPGDVLQSGSETTRGHTAIVTAASVNGNGNGSITTIEQNGNANGWRTYTVSNWVVSGGVTKWLHDSTFADDILMVRQDGSGMKVFRLTGSASAEDFSVNDATGTFDPDPADDHFVAGDFDNDGRIDDFAMAEAAAGGGVDVRVWYNGGGSSQAPAGLWAHLGSTLANFEGRMAIASLD